MVVSYEVKIPLNADGIMGVLVQFAKSFTVDKRTPVLQLALKIEGANPTKIELSLSALHAVDVLERTVYRFTIENV